MAEFDKYKDSRRITAQDSESISRYFSEIRNFQPLTKEEERELIIKVQQHDDKAALNKLISANLRFVVTVAKKYQGQGALLSDLISEGNSGLMTAVKLFNPKEDIKFFSYAVWWIRQRMFVAINPLKRTIRLPDNRWLLVDRIKKEIAALEQQLNRYPSIEELCGYLKDEFKEDDIKEAIIYGTRTSSLQDRVGDEEDDSTLQDTIEDRSLAIDDINRQESVVKDLEKFLFHLTQWEYDVICLSLGLNYEPSIRNEDIAKALKLKSKDIIKLKSRALKKLRRLSGINSLKDYL